MSTPQSPASLRDYVQVVRERRTIVLVVTLLLTLVALAFSLFQSPTYQARARLNFQEATQDVELIGLQSTQNSTPDGRAATGAELVNNRDTVAKVKARLRLPEAIGELQKDIEGRAEVRTNLVAVIVKDGNARRAALIANTVADETQQLATAQARALYTQFITSTTQQLKGLSTKPGSVDAVQRASLERLLSQLRAARKVTSPVEIVEQATVPHTPTSPRPVRNTLIGLIAGLILGIAAAFLRSALDRRLRAPREIADEAGVPLLAVVRDEALGGTGMVSGVDAEAFRILRTNLEYLDVDVSMKRILITSPLPEEGKSTTALGLAQVAALSGQRVLLVGCDLRRPVLGKRTGNNESPGLTEYLAGKAEPSEVTRVIELGEAGADGEDRPPAVLAFVPAGGGSPRPAEMLRSNRFEKFLDDVAEVYDLVVIDSAPLLSVVDTLELVPHVEGIVLCVRSGRTTRDQIRGARDILARLPPKPTGLIVSGVKPGGEGDYGYYSYSYAAD